LASTSEHFTARVRGFMRAHSMARDGARLLAAVSGGADSVCLLNVLIELEFQLEVAHFDHQTRNGESGRDAEFVGETAARLGLPFHVESRPIDQESRGSGKSFEEYARSARYEFLTRVARARGCEAVATGHHADDNAETILMRLIRGTTPGGAAGIPAVGAWGGVSVIRPLLGVTRAEVMAYVAKRGLEYRQDTTNVDVRYARNRVRHELLPLLAERYNPRVREALLRFAEAQRADAELLDTLGRAAFGRCVSEDAAIDRARFRNEPESLQRRMVARLGRLLGVTDMPFDRVVAAARFVADGATGEVFDLGAGVQLQNGRRHTKPLRPPEAVETAETPLAVPGVTSALGRMFRARVLEQRPAPDLAAYCTARRQVFDADAAGADLSVRRRRAGDSFTPLGMTGTKKLQDYFVDAGVPAFERDAQILLTGGGKILWVVGGAVSSHAAVTESTARFLEVDIIDGTEETAALDGGADSEEG